MSRLTMIDAYMQDVLLKRLMKCWITHLWERMERNRTLLCSLFFLCSQIITTPNKAAL